MSNVADKGSTQHNDHYRTLLEVTRKLLRRQHLATSHLRTHRRSANLNWELRPTLGRKVRLRASLNWLAVILSRQAAKGWERRRKERRSATFAGGLRPVCDASTPPKDRLGPPRWSLMNTGGAERSEEPWVICPSCTVPLIFSFPSVRLFRQVRMV